jgi:hypothetical protein
MGSGQTALPPKAPASAEQPRQEASNETGPDIQTLSATAFEDLCSSDEVSDTFNLTLGECKGLLGATTGGHPNHDELNTSGADKAGRSSGSSCGRRAQA